MAVAVKQRLAVELRERGDGGVEFALEKFTEQESLAGKFLGAGVVRKEVEKFVAEDGDATGFESDDGDAGFDFGFERVENFEEQRLSAVEEAEVVEGTSAAEMGAGDEDAVSGGFEDFDGRASGGRMEIVVEGVGPEENLRH
jgi:hypothetical protein